ICDEAGILLIVDEVQTGIARTGWMWAFEAANVVPDAVCVGKAIANGLPLAALVAARELHDRWGRGAHGSTFGGNPVACAAGLALLVLTAGRQHEVVRWLPPLDVTAAEIEEGLGIFRQALDDLG